MHRFFWKAISAQSPVISIGTLALYIELIYPGLLCLQSSGSGFFTDKIFVGIDFCEYSQCRTNHRQFFAIS